MMRPIEPPSRLEKQREITAILDKADLKERRFLPLMARMLKDVGFVNCFRGVGWAPGLCVLVGLFCWGLMAAELSSTVPMNLNFCLQITLFIQPLILTGISLATCILEKYLGMWEMRAVCRYNDKYLLAFRMLFMGIVGMVSVALSLLSMGNVGGSLVMKVFLASSTSYLLCGSILMAALRFLSEKWFWPVQVVWYGLGLFLLTKSYWLNMADWMNSIPLPALLVAALGTAGFYFWQTRQLALSKINEKMGGYWKC